LYKELFKVISSNNKKIIKGWYIFKKENSREFNYKVIKKIRIHKPNKNNKELLHSVDTLLGKMCISYEEIYNAIISNDYLVSQVMNIPIYEIIISVFDKCRFNRKKLLTLIKHN
jgi:hypothetical protein